jgi:dTDP-4-amino-4,6-dideoxygalactose transaminase
VITKSSIHDLAIFGGPPAFSNLLHVGRPNIGERRNLSYRIEKILDNRWLTNDGPYVREFEEKIQALTGAKHALAVCNATIGLQIAARSLGLSGEVIVPSFTFVATAHALQWLGIQPVFCDIDPLTYNIDPQKIPALISPRTSGILGVHVWGRACDIDALASIAAQYHLHLMFDAAHAFGCSYHGKLLGVFGETEVFSFHATKVINTFEGGAIATNDDQVAEKVRVLRNFGFLGYDQVVDFGINGKMSEISAAMGLTNLESLADFISNNQQNYQLYRELLCDVHGVKVIEYDQSERSNFHYIILEIDEKETGVSRDDIVTILHAENILVRRYFYPGCHQMEPYRSMLDGKNTFLPETDVLVTRVMSLPNGTAIGEGDILKICQILRFVIDNGVLIKDALGKSGAFPTDSHGPVK